MTCEFCGGKTTPQKVKRQHWLKGKLYIIENVVAEVCAQCGERYFHAKVLETIDQLLEKKHDVKERMDVEVVAL